METCLLKDPENYNDKVAQWKVAQNSSNIIFVAVEGINIIHSVFLLVKSKSVKNGCWKVETCLLKDPENYNDKVAQWKVAQNSSNIIFVGY